jgi:hypothetical protein
LAAACATTELDKAVPAWQLRPVVVDDVGAAELGWSVPEKEVVAHVRTIHKAQQTNN